MVSSLGVYGASALHEGSVLDEACPLDPQPHRRDPYSYSKVEAEHIAWQSHKDRALPLVVVRPGVIYGPGRGCLSSRVGLQFGNYMIRLGSQKMPYTYVDNCAAAIERAATLPGMEGQAFNIVDDELPTGRQVLFLIPPQAA